MTKKDRRQTDKGWRGQTRGGVFGYAFFIFTIKHLGLRFAYGFLIFVIIHFAIFAPKASYHTFRYARHILKKSWLASVWFLLSNYYVFGQTLIDKLAINGGLQDKYHFEFTNYTSFLELLDGDTGVIMIGAHVGNWEIGAPFFDDYGKHINIVMYDAEHQQIKEVVEQQMRAKNYKIIPIEKESISHVFKITEALAAKEYVCFQGDRHLNSDKVMTSPFLNKNAHFPAGPFLLASRMQVPVVFYFAMREQKRTYRFHFFIADMTPIKGKHKEELLFEQYVIALEQIMQRYPKQWFNYYNFWNL